MARIAGVDLPPSKRIEIGLTYIFGIGRTRAIKILGKARVEPDDQGQGPLRRADAEDPARSSTRKGGVEGDLRKAISLDIKR